MSNLAVVPNWENANQAKRDLLDRFSNLSSVRNAERNQFYAELDTLFREYEKKTVPNSTNRTAITS